MSPLRTTGFLPALSVGLPFAVPPTGRNFLVGIKKPPREHVPGAAWASIHDHTNAIAQPRHSEDVHDEYKIYYNTSDRALIPKWSKATREPGEKVARVIGGYARKIDDTAVSVNAPQFMQIAAVVSHAAKTELASQFRAGKGGFDLEANKLVHGGSFEQKRDDTTVSRDAPDWFKSKVLVAFQEKLDRGEVGPGFGAGIHTYVSGNQIIFEPKTPKAAAMKDSARRAFAPPPQALFPRPGGGPVY
jgi:hypothetical protein